MKKTLIELLKEVPDYRQGNAIRHNLSDILMIGLLSEICNGDTFTDMALFGETHEAVLREFLELPHGIPSHDTFETVFSRLDSSVLSEAFGIWTKELRETLKEATISIDGKTIRRSKSRDKKAVHVVTAFASQMQLVLGQLATDEKSNEITAIPKLLDMFCIKGTIITIDAMGTQTDIASKIIQKEGNYVLAVKGNQGNLNENISLYMETEILTQSKTELKKQGRYSQTLEKGHGRIEKRECYLCPETDWLYEVGKWEGLRGMGVILSRREETGKETTVSKNYFIYSMEQVTAEEMLRIKREHWAIENNLHWTLDMIFREDESRARTENAAENLNILRKQALQMMKQETTVKGSMRAKRLRCAYDLFYALKVIGVK